jgi:hypothetical protein
VKGEGSSVVDKIDTKSSPKSSLVNAATKVSKVGFDVANVTTVGSPITASTT